MKGIYFLVSILIVVPSAALAGTQTYSTPGSYTFTVPQYGSLTVQVWGGGGGGGSTKFGSSGSAGYPSYFYAPNGTLSAGGGGGGGLGYHLGTGGAGGSTSEGTVGNPGGNGTTALSGAGGSALYGGAGGAGQSGPFANGASGSSPGGGGSGAHNGAVNAGGGGGSGGYAIHTYALNELSQGTLVPITVGGGGPGGLGGASIYDGGNGASGRISIIWTDIPPPTCTLTTDWDPINNDIGTILRWSSSNATSMSISSIGSVSPSGGSTAIYPQTNTTYTGTVSGAGGSGSCAKTVTVAPAATASISITPGTINEGDTATLSWGTTNADEGVYISNVGWVSSSGSAEVGAEGTYTITAYGFGGDATASDSLTLLASCTQDSVTLQNGESADFYTYSTAPQGQLCSSLTQARTCADGTLSGPGTYQYASCACTVSSSYSCADTATIVRTTTNADCSATVTTPYATCAAPTFCSAGSAVCIDPTPIYHPSQDGNGHLQARPQLVAKGNTTKLFWNVENVTSCTVTGNDQTWNATAANAGGERTDPIYQRTTFTLACQKIDDTPLTETQVVGTLPGFQER